MKYLRWFFLGMLLFSCTPKNDFYQGKVMDENQKPLENVAVSEEMEPGNHTLTDKNGYFKLHKNPDFLHNLIFKKENYRIDTIPSVGSQSGEVQRYYFITKDTTPVILLRQEKIIEKLDLTTTPAKPGDRSIPETFVNLSSIPKNWVEVKKDKGGYLIYDPCDGYTRTISIKDGFVEIQWQMEPAIKFYYDKFTRITGNKSFRMDLMEDISKEKSDLTAEIFDAKNGIVKFNFNNESWFVTPAENADKFRKVKNNYPDHKVGEMEFEVIK